ncbi:hypothetical protein DFJ74DRAFT_709381 [Hyaloraphidium curvatum]|nr:hypothetical protein DFJ74DRAFT_709381 [Hyaloraphidium curvatum]
MTSISHSCASCAPETLARILHHQYAAATLPTDAAASARLAVNLALLPEDLQLRLAAANRDVALITSPSCSIVAVRGTDLASLHNGSRDALNDAFLAVCAVPPRTDAVRTLLDRSWPDLLGPSWATEKPWIITGHSLGGRIAITLVEHYPKATAVVFNPAFPTKCHMGEHFRRVVAYMVNGDWVSKWYPDLNGMKMMEGRVGMNKHAILNFVTDETVGVTKQTVVQVAEVSDTGTETEEDSEVPRNGELAAIKTESFTIRHGSFGETLLKQTYCVRLELSNLEMLLTVGHLED